MQQIRATRDDDRTGEWESGTAETGAGVAVARGPAAVLRRGREKPPAAHLRLEPWLPHDPHPRAAEGQSGCAGHA